MQNERNEHEPDRWAWAVALAISVGVALRAIQFGAGTSLWYDELALVLNLEAKDAAALACESLDHRQVAPVAFVLTCKGLATLFGWSEYVLRSPSFIAGVLASILFWRVARRVLRGPWLAGAVLVFATSPALVDASASVKPYAGDVAAATGLVALALSRCEREWTTRRSLAAGALGALAILFSFPAAPLAAAIGLVLVVRLRTMALAPVLVPWAVAALVQTTLALDRLEASTSEYMQEFWSDAFPPSGFGAFEWLARALHRVVVHTLMGDAQGIWPRVVACGLGLSVIVGAIHASRRDRERASLIMLPLAVAVALAFARVLPVHSRLTLFAVWPFILFGAIGGRAIVDSRRAPIVVRRLALAAASLVVSAPALRSIALDPPPREKEPLRPVLRDLAAEREESDLVWVYYGARYAVEFYGPRLGLGDWIEGGEHRDAPDEYRRELDALRGTERLWIVWSHAVPALREIELLREHVTANGRIVRELDDPFGSPQAGAWLVDLSRP